MAGAISRHRSSLDTMEERDSVYSFGVARSWDDNLCRKRGLTVGVLASVGPHVSNERSHGSA